jgi:hypothetical protein
MSSSKLTIGLVGLPNVGKSTLFQAITQKQVPRENYPFCTIEPHVGTVAVPDEKLKKLTETSSSAKTISTTIEFTDIAGLVEGAHKGEGLGNQFLSHIREVDAICQVVRLFTDSNVTHVHGDIDPKHDIEIIQLELIMADTETVEKRLSSLQKKLKGDPTKEEVAHAEILQKALPWLQNGKLLNTLDVTLEEKKILHMTNLLTIKPMLYAYNIDELTTNTKIPEVLPNPAIPLSATFELELSSMKKEEAGLFLKEANLTEPGIDTLIKESYRLLQLITFYTSGEMESRAWTLKRGSTAKEGAECIHSDIADGFAKADVMNFEDFVKTNGWSGARESGTLRSEGKDYIMQDGDVVYFNFSK